MNPASLLFSNGTRPGTKLSDDPVRLDEIGEPDRFHQDRLIRGPCIQQADRNTEKRRP